jgi:DNA-binding CsgD family transcriptional regulator
MQNRISDFEGPAQFLQTAKAEIATVDDVLCRVAFGVVWLSEGQVVTVANPAAVRLTDGTATVQKNLPLSWYSHENQLCFEKCWRESVETPQWFAAASSIAKLLVRVRRMRVSTFPGTIQTPGVVAIWHGGWRQAPSETVLRAAFELTNAESELARELISCKNLRVAAQRCGVTYSTARSYLKQILAKTMTRRQAELISLLLQVQAAVAIE